MSETRQAVIAGAAAGAITGLVIGLGVKWVIDWQVTQTIEREVPPRIRQELDVKLAQLGLTPQVASQIASAVTGLDQAGVFATIGQVGQSMGGRR